MLPGIQHREQPGSYDAGTDRGERPAIERIDAMPGAGLAQVAGECGDHQHSLEALAEQDDGGLDEGG